MGEEKVNELIIFTHSICSGGGDLTRFIQKSFFVKNMLCGTDPKGQALNTAKKRMDARTSDLIRRYKKKLESNRSVNFIYGHTPFIMNSESIFNRKIHNITMLRDPIKRFISHHRRDINNNNSLQAFKEWVKWIENGKHDLGYKWVEFNHQTDMFSGYQSELMSTNDLKQAKENLKKFTFIGLTEEYDNSVELLTKIFHFPYTYRKPLTKYKAKNVITIDPSIVQYIKEKSHFDIDLYEYGKKIYEKQKSKYKDVALISPTNIDKYLTYPIKDIDYLVGKIKLKISNKLFNDIAEI